MSSFFDDASLVMIPSGYKTSKVYSVKPTDGTGDLTFTRSNSTATRVGPDGLIEKVRTNLYPRGSALLSTGWTSAGATLTAGQTDPDGGTGALRVQLIAGTSFLYQGFSGSSTYNRSVYIKAATAQTIKLVEPFTGAFVLCNLTTSYQRFNLSAVGAGALFGIQFDNTNDSAAKDFTIAFVQIEEGDIATPYIPTTTAAVSVGPVANVPRLDYLNSSCPRLLLEPQRTNLVTYSEQFDNAAWTKATLGGAALTTVVTANQAVSPDGYTNADKVFMSLGGGTTSSDWARLQSAAFNVTNGTAYTISFYAWASQSLEVGKKVRVGVGGNTALLDFTLTATAQRFSVTYTAASTGTDSLLFQLRGAEGLSSTAEFFLWGAQVEAGAYATSYIPTLGAAVTRGADAASKTGISSLIGQTEGTLFVETTYNGATNSAQFNRIINITDGSLDNFIAVSKNFGTAQLYVYSQVGGVPQVDSSAIANTNLIGTHKIAFAYKENDFVLYVDGVQRFTDTSGLVAACSQLNIGGIGALGGGADQLGGSVNQALLFPTRLSNADLAALTA